uniref:Cardiolipin synthetase putative n=1 Tax=Albugo laibachii Nc14 TaxID=890382 RepID=F0WLH4_9STRA|nr:cardiolipin synthetase putative [Albugo laibachii Nc14]|eukprot:CCA22137.1 cardiolipin synthetase putative [Albugo laibachii Nc14]
MRYFVQVCTFRHKNAIQRSAAAIPRYIQPILHIRMCSEKTQRCEKSIKKFSGVAQIETLARLSIWNVPNAITFTRILATPYLAFVITQANYTTAIGVLAFAGVSDWLDGYIARTCNTQSILGSFLDPLADKMIIASLSGSMVWAQLIPLPLAVLIFGRDVLLVGGTFYHRYRTKRKQSAFFDTTDSSSFGIKPSRLSKLNTALQFTMFGCTLSHSIWGIPQSIILDPLFGLVGVTTLVSGMEYLSDYIQLQKTLQSVPKVSESEKPSASSKQ